MSRTMSRNILKFFSFLSAAALVACAPGAGDSSVSDDNDPPLASRDELFEGAPKADTLRDEYKSDEIFPDRFTDLLAFQSPVKNQARRGVCSIFSSTALMEHLYILEGSIEHPDFSEQYLQWAAKFQAGGFPSDSGSNDAINLGAISRFGIVEESEWPYEPDQWGAADDADCDGGEEQPTKCYTNGHPTDEVKAAPKFFLPRSRFLSPRSIKGHMVHQGQAVVVGLDFFYQSWNHRKSTLPVNPGSWARGIVLFPNADDRRISLEKRAGHAILLVGWDDKLEVQTVDKDGKLVFDAQGKPVMERGFYIFKNSWGTGNFGRENPHGDGYGFISMRYINEFGSVRVADLPVLN